MIFRARCVSSWRSILPFTIMLALTACGGGNTGASSGTGGGSGSTPPPSTANEWMWVSGNNAISVDGVYGSQGIASASNVPGARYGSVSWTDGSGNLWLFGGNGLSSTGPSGELNDLWEFSPTAKTWTWEGGSNTASAVGGPIVSGVYGTQGVASVNNVPGPRDTAVSWTDNSGNLWLFGGYGYDSAGNLGLLSDLWEFSPVNKEWSWMSGSNTVGTAPGNAPGPRRGAVSWTDSSGDLWLFGGDGTTGELNDLWEFSPTGKTWTSVCGSTGACTSGLPSGREGSVGWKDSGDNLWLYGGGNPQGSNSLNDLWEFNITSKEWTLVSGSSGNGGVAPVYGTQGVPSANNTPGGLSYAVGWADTSGNLWLFGGFYQASSQSGPYFVTLNALWKFTITNKEWTWVGGDISTNARGIYGTLGVASASNFPGARMWAVGWTDNSGNFWLFGGDGYGANDTQTSPEGLNDLWHYQP